MNVWVVFEICVNIAGINYVILKESPNKKCSKKSKVIGIALTSMVYILAQIMLRYYEMAAFCIRVVINVFALGILHKVLYKGSLLIAICKGLIVYQVYKAMLLVGLISSYGLAFIIKGSDLQIVLYGILFIVQLIGSYLLGKLIRKVDLNKMLDLSVVKWMVLILSIGILCVFIGAVHLTKTDMEYMTSICYLIVIICVLVGAVWLYDKQAELKAQKKLEDENVELAAKVHKTKEIIPAVALELQELNMEDLASDSRERLKQLMEEMKALHNTYVGDSSTGFVTQTIDTGYRLLNRQLEGYIMEAADKRIEFMVMMRNRPKEMNITLGITQGEIQQIIGDVVRNAIRAIDRSGNQNGRILLCFGYLHDEDGYVLEVYDNGAPFPREILEHFGERGMTTGGTGHGLADIVEVVEKYGGKVEVEQLSEDIYSKAVRIWLKRAKNAGKYS